MFQLYFILMHNKYCKLNKKNFIFFKSWLFNCYDETMCTYSFLKSFRLSVSFCRSCQDGAFDSFREKMQDLRVEAYTTSGKIHAHVTCPICDDSKQSKISLNMDTTGSWHIFAFKRHCKTFHIQTPHSSKQKRRSVTPVATDDANENDCPIKRPSLESTGIGTACGILKRLNEVVHTNF